MNPWNLSEKQRLALNLLVEHGSQKVVAMEMGLTAPLLSAMFKRARKRSGEKTNTLMLLEWDRMHRGQE
ncbi:MAG: hypothetical protein WC023_06490 [Rhodocyclaceae bacterium]